MSDGERYADVIFPEYYEDIFSEGCAYAVRRPSGLEKCVTERSLRGAASPQGTFGQSPLVLPIGSTPFV